VPFPFPHTQLTTFYVVVITFYLPILMLTFVSDIAVAATLNFLTVGIFLGLWQVSNELEDPFRNVPNDLPLNLFQAEFNEALIVMFAGYHPESWWDIGDNKEGVTFSGLEPLHEEVVKTPKYNKEGVTFSFSGLDPLHEEEVKTPAKSDFPIKLEE